MDALSPALVLYAADPAATRRFYEVLGLVFRDERHGNGPAHHACDLGGSVLEVYPKLASMGERGVCRHVRLVFTVDDVMQMWFALRGAGVVADMAETSDGPIVRALDPDGIQIMLLQR